MMVVTTNNEREVGGTLVRTYVTLTRRQNPGESRRDYLRRAANYARRKFDALLQTPDYEYSHESFALRDALLIAESVFVDCGTFGVEYISKGHNQRSPAIDYLNTGDSYELTVMVVRGRFVVACWGDIVERGNYD